MSKRKKTPRHNAPAPAGAQTDPDASVPPQDALDALRVKLRRRAEAGVQLGHREWDGWPVTVQNIWLQEVERVHRLRAALNAQAIASALGAGQLVEDMVYEELPDGAQAEMLQQRAQDEMVARMGGRLT